MKLQSILIIAGFVILSAAMLVEGYSEFGWRGIAGMFVLLIGLIATVVCSVLIVGRGG